MSPAISLCATTISIKLLNQQTWTLAMSVLVSAQSPLRTQQVQFHAEHTASQPHIKCIKECASCFHFGRH